MAHRKHSGGGAQRNRMRSAAKACKGRKRAAFRSCMRTHLKRRK